MPGTGILLPTFELPDGVGGASGTSARPRRELLLALLHPRGCVACDGMRGALALADGAIEERGTRLLLLSPDPPRRPEDLQDEGGLVARRIAGSVGRGEEAPLLIAADRFGEVYGVLPVHGLGTSAALADAIAWIDYIRTECPECGAPAW